ncbi:NifB/NifX family molybdenum-iron cluster-binding protein [Candidatus Pyrohabitans sp.]
MKVAVAADAAGENAEVSQHFGRAGYFLIYELTPESFSFMEARENPKARGGHFHEAILPVLEDVEVVISAGIGRGAYSHLIAEDKKVVIINVMPAKEAVEKLARGELRHEPGRIHSGHHHAHGHTHY